MKKGWFFKVSPTKTLDLLTSGFTAVISFGDFFNYTAMDNALCSNIDFEDDRALFNDLKRIREDVLAADDRLLHHASAFLETGNQSV
ncbi:hypothetical protein WDW86_16730 [Bdellovibrionota bacterium FG-2]